MRAWRRGLGGGAVTLIAAAVTAAVTLITAAVTVVVTLIAAEVTAAVTLIAEAFTAAWGRGTGGSARVCCMRGRRWMPHMRGTGAQQASMRVFMCVLKAIVTLSLARCWRRSLSSAGCQGANAGGDDVGVDLPPALIEEEDRKGPVKLPARSLWAEDVGFVLVVMACEQRTSQASAGALVL